MSTKFKFCSVLILGIVSGPLSAQVLIKSQKTLGGNSPEGFHTICVTKDGGLILGGSSASNISGEKTEKSRGTSDYWVIKLDSSGGIEWDKTIGGKNDDVLFSIIETINGGYMLGGFSFSGRSGDKSTGNRGNADYWVVKLNGLGNIEWDTTIGGHDDDELYSMEQTRDSGYILGGFSYSNRSKEKSDTNRGAGDFWVVKLDQVGNMQWNKTIGGNDEDEIKSLQQTKDGGYILGGFSASKISGDKTENTRGGNDYWIVKLDSIGNIQWQKTIGGSGEDILNSLYQTDDEGYILAGYSQSNISGEKSENSRGSQDYWVVKTDSLGNILWQKTIGGNNSDILNSVENTKDKGYVLAGTSASITSGEKTEDSKGGPDYWLVKLDSVGNIQWDKTVGGSFEDQGICVKESANNTFIVGGTSLSGISGDKTDPSRGSYDYWVVWLDDNSTLPATLVNLRAYQVNNFVRVEWTSLTEINVARYEIERSSNSLCFTTIGTVLAGKGTEQKNYSFNDLQPLKGKNYYRVKVQDRDGKVKFSSIALVNNRTTLTVFPNPCKDLLHVQAHGKVVVTLTDESGKTLLAKTIEGNGVMYVAPLKSGTYYLKNNSTGMVNKVIVIK